MAHVSVDRFDKVTTSSKDGIVEVQSITTRADSNSILGFFTLTFDGETTERLAHNAEADGDKSVESALERLPNVGDVEVTRAYSWRSIPELAFDLTTGSNVLSEVGGNHSLGDIIAVGDRIRVGEETHSVASVGVSTVTLDDAYTGPSGSSVTISAWAFGFEWTVTFLSHVGEQPLLIASPADNWAGTNPVIETSRVQEGQGPISGTFRLGFGGERAHPLPHDADASLVKQALESLSTVGEVDVSRFVNNNGFNYFVTFLTELGDLELMTVDDSHLLGPDAQARVAAITDGAMPEDYGSMTVMATASTATVEQEVAGLVTGVPYEFRIRSRNSKGLGYAGVTSSHTTPIKEPSSPTSVSMFALSDARIRISWTKPLDDGGAPIEKYGVQWDTDPSFPSAWKQEFYHERTVTLLDDTGYCHTISIEPSSSSVPRFGRVLAYNGHEWSSLEDATAVTAAGAMGKPGPVRSFSAEPTSEIGFFLSWSPPEIDDSESCGYAGDGGSSISHYHIEYDLADDFSSPAVSVEVPGDQVDVRIGGRDVTTGSESTELVRGGSYFVRITPFNALGPGTTVTLSGAVGPLVDSEPSAPALSQAVATSATSILVAWDPPQFDGGSKIQGYVVEYDTDPAFQSSPRNVSVPTLTDVKSLHVSASDVQLNVQKIQATVAVTNEVQSIKTQVAGMDEVQEFSLTSDDVVAEVQRIETTAVDTDEEQSLSLMSDDIDEIQLIRVKGENQEEIQVGASLGYDTLCFKYLRLKSFRLAIFGVSDRPGVGRSGP